MKGEKDEGKQMAPLFPGLHISDGDKGGPRAPPRNKMALFEEYSVNSQSGPRPLLPVLPSDNGCSNFASSSNVAGVKRKVRPVLAAMNEYAHSSEWHYPHCSGGVSGPTYYPNPSSSSSLMMKAKCISVQPPCGFSSYGSCTDENDFGVSSFLQSGKILNYGNLHLHMKKEKIDTFSSNQLKETTNLGEERSRLSQNGLQRDHLKKGSTGDETSGLDFPQKQLCLEFKSLHKSKTVDDDMSALCGRRRSTFCVEEDSARSPPRGGDCNQRANIDNDSLSLKIGEAAVKREETLDGFTQDSILGLDLATDEVVRVIGQRLFLKARKAMVHQQKIFSLQMFELHRLITVQRHIARSPEILHENTFDPNKPSIKFPPINKLLYVSPLDPSPPVAKAKLDPLKSNLGADCGSEALCGLVEVEKGLLPQQKPNPPSLPVDPKIAPWCLPVPTANQWLVPMRSPSEGLIYKPYPGPCFPSVGFMGPVYGNCGPISLSSLGGAGYDVPPPSEQGNGGFCSSEVSQNYLQPYAMPLIPSAGSQAGELDKSSSSNFFVPHQLSCKVSSQQSAVVSECGGNLHRSNGSEMQGSNTETSPRERLEGDALSLFPTMPSLQRNEQRVHAIKVVPHNRMSASASAARIFQSIQEERRKQE